MNKFKYTTFGQMLEVLKSYAANVVIFAFVWVTFAALWTKRIGAYLFVFISLISIAMSIYGCGEKAAKDDKKPYVERGVSLKRSFLIPALVILVNIIMVVVFKLTWVFGSDGESITKMWSVATNLLSYGWFAPLGTLAGLDKGSISVLGIILMIIIPEVCYVLGYFAGMKNFDINEKLFGFMYEKKAQNKK